MIVLSHVRAELAPTLRLAVPVVFAELGWMAMGVVDTLMVGPLGPAAIGAAGVGNALHMVFAIFGMGLLLGLDTLVSQAYGAGRLEDCRRWLAHGLALAAVLAPAITLICFGVLLSIPRLGFHPDVMPLLQDYYSIVIWSTPMLIGYAALRRYLQGMHRPTPVMSALVSANIVNAAANWGLIYGHFGLPALGIAGAAWATVFARLYMLLVLVIAARQLRFSFERPALRRLVELGFPAASQVTLEVGAFAAATALAGMLTPVATASHQIGINIIAVAYMIPLGIASAGAVRVGFAVGAGDPSRAAAAGWTALLLGGGFMACTAATMLAVPRALIGLFTRDADVLALGSSLLFVGAIFQLFDGIQGVATGVLRGLGDTRTPMITNLAGHWLFGLPIGATLCFALGYGVIGLWVGLSIGLILVAVVLSYIWQRRISAYQQHQATLAGTRRDGRPIEPAAAGATPES